MNPIKFALLGLIGIIGLVISIFGPFKIPFAETLAKNYYRYAIAGLMVVVFLLAGVIALAAHLLDPNQFKSQIVRMVHERTQRELVLDGELELSWFPKLGFKAGKATLSQRRSAREFASIDSARFTIAWLPLLRRQVLIDWAEVEGLRTQLVRFKDGSTNVDDLVRGIATISPGNVDIQGLLLKRSHVQWNDEIGFQSGSLNDLNIEVGQLADGFAAPLTASLRVHAPQAGVDARVSLKGRLLFDAQVGRVELAKLDAQLEGKALGVANLALAIKADLTGHFGLHTMSVENLVVTSASKFGLNVVNARLVAPELRLIERRFQGNRLSMDLSVAHPDHTLTAALQVPSFEATARSLRGATANAQMSIRSADAQLRVQMASPVSLDLEAGSRIEFEAVDLSAEASHPALSAQLPLNATGKLVLDLAQRSLHFALNGKLAGDELRGQVALSDWLGPHWSFELASTRLDLDALLAQPCLARWRDDAVPVDLSFLRDLTLVGHLRADRFKLCGLTTTGVSAQFDAQRTALRVAPITAQAYGGVLEASIEIDATGAPRLASKGSLSALDLRALRADVAQLSWIEGHGELAWDLHSQGRSIGTLRSGLTGDVSLVARTGKFKGIDLRTALLEGPAGAGSARPVRQQAYDAGASTAFTDLKAHIELRAGSAQARSLEFNSASVHTVGSGELTFDAGEIDLHLNASVAQAAKEFAALAGKTVPIQLEGLWRAPQFTLDFSAASAPIARKVQAVAAAAPAAAPTPRVPSRAKVLSARGPRVPALRTTQ